MNASTFTATGDLFSSNITQDYPNGGAVADIDSDGDLDLILSRNTSNNFDVRLNDGIGSFATLFTIAGGGQGVSVETVDVNGDGNLDVVVANPFGFITEILNTTYVPQVTVSLSLSSPSAVPVSVDYTLANGLARLNSDYRASAATVTFPPGVTTQTITLRTLRDNLDEPNENFFVNLSAPVNATIGDSQGQVTIVDDDGGVIAASTLVISDVTLAASA